MKKDVGSRGVRHSSLKLTDESVDLLLGAVGLKNEDYKGNKIITSWLRFHRPISRGGSCDDTEG